MKCTYCGNTSERRDYRGGCISCGAPIENDDYSLILYNEPIAAMNAAYMEAVLLDKIIELL